MITLKELQAKSDKIDKNHWVNVEEYLTKINEFRQAYGKPMIVTSFYRSLDHHIEIYKELARKKRFPFLNGIYDPKRIPMSSLHLKGLACDFYDADHSIHKFCKENIPLLEKIGLWVENELTVPRCHLQIRPPKSGNRFFMP